MPLGDLAREDDYGEPDPWTAAAERMQRKYLGRNIVGTGERSETDVVPEFIRRGFAGKLGDIAALGSTGVAHEFGPQYDFTREQAAKEFEHQVGPLDPQPGFGSRVASEGVRMALDPTSWVGPGGVPYKAGFNALAAFGGETGATVAPAGYEQAGRALGSFTPMAAERAIPYMGRLVPQGSLGSLGGSMVIPSERAPPFYSAVEQAVIGSKQPQAPAAQWLATLRNAPGVKPAELEQLGLEDWLRQQGGPVSKQALADYVAANKVQLGEAVKGPPKPLADTFENYLATYRERFPTSRQTDAAVRGFYDRAIPMPAPGQLSARISGPPAKFSAYQLPGGENYRETLLTLPTADKRYTEYLTSLREKYGDIGFARMPLTEAESIRIEQLMHRADNQSVFQGSHWDEPNVLAHLRTNERNIGGKKTLFVEEAQSDWLQVARKKEQFNQIESEIASLRELPPTAELNTKLNELFDQRSKIGRSLQEYRYKPVPSAPFQSNWHELAMKRAIREAAEGGFEQLAWTPGSVQNKRYPDPNRPDSAMEGFYDKMLPAAANKIGKPHGAQVAREGAATGLFDRYELGEDIGGRWRLFDRISNEAVGPTFRSGSDAEKWRIAQGKTNENVHVLPITPSLREQALRKGFPLFAVPGAVLGGLAAQDQYQQ
jgi:hypothetical protein